jgi:peptide/nickel transport system substrate-binding protein
MASGNTNFEGETRALDDEARSLGISREELLKRAAVAGIFVTGMSGGLVRTARAALEASTPKRGGTFRIGVSGGSAKDLIDGQHIVTRPDQARIVSGWEGLVRFSPQYHVVHDALADLITAERADLWTIRLRKGVEFHNGKTVTANDVIYSLRRMLDPKLGLFGGAALKGSVDPKRIKKLDKYTVRLQLMRKDSNLLDELAQYTCNIVPVGYNRYPGKQVGTGPYMLRSFTPGQRSVHVRNPNYWKHGQPYFDQVIVIDFPDDTARVNALLSGQVDAITDVPPAQVAVVNGHSNTHVLESPSANWTPICMRVDAAPFNDVRVRQAMRLIADRPQIVKQALSGHGRIGNDLYAPFDENYARSLPQRHQDIDRAKSLLKAAGQQNLTADLQTTNGALGQNEGAQVFAQQAKAAGVKINVKELDSGAFYGDQYLKWVLSTDFWGTRNYLSQVSSGSLSTAPFNETHWNNARFVKLYKEALATVNRKKRREIEFEMQKMEYNSGGYLIWGFSSLIDGYGSKVKGLTQGDKGILPLNGFGHGYRTIWFG